MKHRSASARHAGIIAVALALVACGSPTATLKAGHRIEDVGAALPEYDKLWVEVKGNQ